MGLFGPPDVDKLKAKRNVDGLTKALSYPKDTVRVAAASALGTLGAPEAVAPLIAALGDAAGSVRAAAAGALGALRDPRAIEPLITALKDSSEPGRTTVVSALGQIGAPALPALIATLGGPSVEVRAPAARALAAIGSQEAVESLVAALADPYAQAAAATSLDKLAWTPDKSQSGARYRVIRGQWDRCVEIGAPAVAPLIEGLRSWNYTAAGAAAKALGQIGDPMALEPLIRALKEFSARQAIFTAQPRTGAAGWADAESIKALATARQMAVEALGALGSPAVEPLIEMLGADDKLLRQAAANALGQIGNTRALEALTEAAARWIFPNWKIVEALIASGPEQDKREKLAMLITTYAAAEGRYAPYESSAELYFGAKRPAAHALAQLGLPSSVPLLIGWLTNADPGLRENAALALGRIGDPRAVPALTERALHDDYRIHLGETLASHHSGHPVVRCAAIVALQHIGDPTAQAALAQLPPELFSALSQWLEKHGSHQILVEYGLV